MRLHLTVRDPEAVGAAPLLKREDLDAFAAGHGYPFIVKPADGTASLGVFRVAAPADADRVWAEVERLRGTHTDRISTLFVLQDFLMEEYVGGPEFSVESFSFAGRHVVVAITEKFVGPRHFAELGHAVPARLKVAVAEEVRERVRGFLDLIGLRDGVCYTEVRPGARGPAIGDTVRALKDNWDRLGLVAVTGPDATATIRRGAELVSDTVEIRIAGADGSGSRGRVTEAEDLAPVTGGVA
ncbi:ATP-grasp domain-containing protein [Streptomyces sp. NBC_00576]|uniref:ATP-grasp domain-containing protein n=1 Tax=Streptomyces sp. NBC_00576 TaxID=2903665 RepID=UPI002E818741|nr:ATP-grasp domain-containing protein [Streptomyces sp. NBC_00576]WUB73474.1 ATP-grasp domain-containing protein [Streptomyces sp. NBC_00576]